jgi:aminoglycoside phosphotransferase (APT) family kinase protein
MNSEGKARFIGTPKSEVELDIPLVYSLLKEQHPDLAPMPISPVDAGWDNAIFRLGDKLCIRFPRRQVAAKLIENEQTWLPQLAEKLPIPIPNPYRIGTPAQGYPWRWSILPWMAGVSADLEEPHANQAKLFASFLKSLHLPAPCDAPVNPFRGVPLRQRVASVEERMQRLEMKTNVITPKIKQIWNQALEATIDVESTWLHGDLHPRNVIVDNGAITGIIDWGDITSGDIATDLASVWMLLSNKTVREKVISEYRTVSEATLQRAKGWAILFGVVLLDTGLVDNPQHAVMGERTLSRVADG